jgi:hypothetical protein
MHTNHLNEFTVNRLVGDRIHPTIGSWVCETVRPWSDSYSVFNIGISINGVHHLQHLIPVNLSLVWVVIHFNHIRLIFIILHTMNTCMQHHTQGHINNKIISMSLLTDLLFILTCLLSCKSRYCNLNFVRNIDIL